ncbi:MAG: type II toxin-antitoxin system HicB family antitoxin [Fimbriimonadaceae bacterium]|nr:type II toxin-antitoxin system HicB family antitoxin [Fimbriimonadaceae bacterium]
MKFQVIFTFDEEYQGYVAEVPELPGCFSQGKSLDEAMANIREAIDGVLRVLKDRGEPYVPHTRPVLVGEIAV